MSASGPWENLALDLPVDSKLHPSRVARLRISELAERTGLSTTDLSYYESIGRSPPRRPATGTASTTSAPWTGSGSSPRAKQLGLSLDEVRDLVDVWDRDRRTPVRSTGPRRRPPTRHRRGPHRRTRRLRRPTPRRSGPTASASIPTQHSATVHRSRAAAWPTEVRVRYGAPGRGSRSRPQAVSPRRAGYPVDGWTRGSLAFTRPAEATAAAATV